MVYSRGLTPSVFAKSLLGKSLLLKNFFKQLNVCPQVGFKVKRELHSFLQEKNRFHHTVWVLQGGEIGIFENLIWISKQKQVILHLDNLLVVANSSR